MGYTRLRTLFPARHIQKRNTYGTVLLKRLTTKAEWCMSDQRTMPAATSFGTPWLLQCLAFALHVWDEAAHDFLSYYNSTVLALYGHFSWFPRMDLQFRSWLAALLVVNLVLLALTPWAYRNVRWLRPLAYAFAGIQLLNGAGHIVAAICGRTVPSVHFEGPAPGVYTAPLLIVLAAYLILALRKSRASSSN